MASTQFELRNRFTRQILTFAGTSSKDFLLYLSGPGVYNAPSADVTQTSLPGVNGDLMQDNAPTGQRRFNNVEITYEAYFFNGLPAKTSAVKSWLLSPVGYQKLQDTYDPDFFRMAICTNALEFEVTRQKVATMSLTFNCKPQRWSVEGQNAIDISESGAVLYNPFAFYAQPLILVEGAGTVTIGDYSVEVQKTASSGTRSLVLTLDCETQNAYTSEDYQTDETSFTEYYGFRNDYIYSEQFPVLAPGENTIEYTGFTSVRIVPRWWTL